MWEILMILRIISADLTFCNQMKTSAHIRKSHKFLQHLQSIFWSHYQSATELNLFSSYFSINWKKHFEFNFPPSSMKNNQINSCKKIRNLLRMVKNFHFKNADYLNSISKFMASLFPRWNVKSWWNFSTFSECDKTIHAIKFPRTSLIFPSFNFHNFLVFPLKFLDVTLS
jgi:hypothetical protein